MSGQRQERDQRCLTQPGIAVFVLGTDGFGRSDTRAALRSFFEVNRHHIVLATLDALTRAGRIERSLCAQAIQRYGIDTEADASWSC